MGSPKERKTGSTSGGAIPNVDRMARLALIRGYVTFDQIRQAGREQEAAGESNESVSEILIRKGWLKPSDILAISLSPRAEETTLGRYRLLYPVARGTYGIIYRAHDPDLNREIALKVFEDVTSKRQRERLLREARIAARLVHPHIVRIHDTGQGIRENQPVHYIAMEFVEGETFERFENGSEPEIALEVLEQVARAVGHGHSQKIVHRDLKPANVLLTPDGRAKVTDFGLARHEDMERLTRTGALIGTVHYMAPEQVLAEHDQIGPHTDVWALGVMLYESQTGIRPFEGEIMTDIFDQIRQAEPVLPRQHSNSISRDLESICMRALARQPSQRYPNGSALADDLARFRAGDPVRARPPRRLDAWRRSARRHRVPLVIGLTTLLILGGLAVFNWQTTEPPSQRLHQRALLQLRKRTGTALKVVLSLRRAGRLGEMNARATRAEAVCREAMRDLPELAEPHYRLGRLLRALMRQQEAIDEQNEALQLEPNHRGALYERIVLTSDFLRERLDQLVQNNLSIDLARSTVPATQDAPLPEGWKEPSPTRDDPLVQRWTQQILRDLETLERTDDEHTQLEPGQMTCVRGYLAWNLGKTAEARDFFRRSIDANPLIEEAYQAIASLELYEGNHEAAQDWWTRGLKNDRGYVPHLLGRSISLFRQARLSQEAQSEVESHLKRAWSDLDRAIESQPNRTAVRLIRATMSTWFAQYRRRHDRDPTDQLRLAIADYDAYLQKHAGNSAARALLAQAWGWWGANLHAQGEDPTPQWNTATKHFDEAIRLAPRESYPRMLRGSFLITRHMLSVSEMNAPPEHLLGAIEELDESLRIDPDLLAALDLRSTAWKTLGLWQARRGKDPTPAYGKSILDLETLQARRPAFLPSYLQLAQVHSQWMIWEHQAGRAGSEHLEAARTAYRTLFTIDADHPRAWIKFCAMEAFHHRWLLEHQNLSTKECDALAGELLSVADRAVQAGSNRSVPWATRASIRLERAAWLFQHGRNPSPLLQGALSDASRSLHLEDAPLIRELRAQILHELIARTPLQMNPGRMVERAVGDLDSAFERGTPRAALWSLRGRLLLLNARYLGRTNQNPRAFLERSLESFSRAIQMDPDGKDAYGERAEVLRLLGLHAEQSGANPEQHYRAAIAELTQMTKRWPKNAKIWRALGIAQLFLGRFMARQGDRPPSNILHEAVAAYTEAVRLDPALEQPVQAEIEICRKLLLRQQK